MRELGKEPETYYNYQKSYEDAVRAEKRLSITNEIIDLRKYDKQYWIVEYKKKETEKKNE